MEPTRSNSTEVLVESTQHVGIPDVATGGDVPMVDLIVVSWNHAKFMDALFASLSKLDYPRYRWRLHVVINKDGDGTLEAVERLRSLFSEALPEVYIHQPHANLGFSGGNNLAIGWAMRNGTAFVYLLNPDTEIRADALSEAVKVARSERNVGVVQSLLLRGDDQTQINSRGNALHFMGFGYCLGDHDPAASAPVVPTDIPYASGAGMLIPLDTLQEVGLLDETLHSYHEDLDFGWRVLLAGKRSILAPHSVVVHHYEFSRSIAKWEFMERNRWLVLLKNFDWRTLLVLLPALISTDAAIWAFSVKGGWFFRKVRANTVLFKPSTWRYLMAGREQIRRIRRVPDAFVFSRMVSRIQYQELKSGWAERIANPFWEAMYVGYRFIIRW